jgi:indolepyruvate ferredoxin oxidoreductase alpha subunit
MHKLLEDTPGKEMLLLGNEAIARGALEAGVAFTTCYPGTPSSEIPEQFFNISRESDLYFEYSTNEKVALEVGAGAAVSGLRTMVTMKHVGLNVAADPLMTLSYTGVKGGMVVINADDPSLFSSQNEQDNRYYARLSGLPMLEPTNTQEMKDWSVAAFDLSEETGLPVIVRTTTRLAHIRGSVKFGTMRPRVTRSHFKKNPFHFVCVPAVSRNLHKELLQKYDQLLAKSEKTPFNQIIGSGKWGIVTNGVSFNYVMDGVNDLGIADKVSVLKIGFSWPLPKELCGKFMKSVEKVLVVEELEPVMENSRKGNSGPHQRQGRGRPVPSFRVRSPPGKRRAGGLLRPGAQCAGSRGGVRLAAPAGETSHPVRRVSPSRDTLCGQRGLWRRCDQPHGHRVLHPRPSAAPVHG